jgi:uncharacterized protein (TIGR00159 family)
MSDVFPELIKNLAQWQVLLDILIFAFVIFVLSRTLHATGTWKIAIGLAIAALVAAIASMIGLRGVEWIFSNLSQFTLIVLIVIFQPEIRKILERTTSLIRSRSQNNGDILPALIEDTLFVLAGKKWGAIIVIPGKDPLQQWITEGVRVDAITSFPLLISIFDPNSPGHDGAVIMENDRIARIGVHLPLSQTDKLPESYGTRHYASMGLAEKTDALVLTVSEERGRITIFYKGAMLPVEKKGDISSQIIAHNKADTSTIPPAQDKKARLWPIVIEIGASLAVAALFWTTVIMSKTETREMIFTVPIQYTGLQKNLVLEGNVPPEVKLHLEGSSSLLTTLDLTQLRVQVDLSRVTEGRQTIALSDQNVQVTKRVKVVDLSPSFIAFEVKALHETILPIKPQLVGKTPEGMKIGPIKLIPNNVRVLMPETGKNFQAPRYLLTTPIYTHALKESATVYCKIIVPAGIQTLDRRWPDVEVQLNVTIQKNN